MGGTTGTINIASALPPPRPLGTDVITGGTLSGSGNRDLFFGFGCVVSAGAFQSSFSKFLTRAVSGQKVTIRGPSTAIINCGTFPGFTQSGSQLGALNVIGITMTNCRPAIRVLSALTHRSHLVTHSAQVLRRSGRWHVHQRELHRKRRDQHALLRCCRSEGSACGARLNQFPAGVYRLPI